MTVRPSRPDDFARVREIERAAGQAFRPLGMDLVADDEPFTDAELAAYQEDGRGWVAADADDVPPGIARIRARERAHGLDRWPRVTMRQPLVPDAPA